MSSKKPVAIFDFDGTLYRGDSLVKFCFYVYRRQPWQARFFLLQLAGFGIHACGLISTDRFKNIFLSFLSGLSRERVDSLVKDFWEKEYPSGFFPEMLERLSQHRKEGIVTVCVSASPELYLAPIVAQLQMNALIGSRLDEQYRLIGNNCKGPEKAARYVIDFPTESYEVLYAYGDKESDGFVNALAHTAHRVTSSGNAVIWPEEWVKARA